ncbi:MAG: phosphatase PAP2 family protein [Ezakiella sp.]|nr:phosphatase PAP2 family protein [Ezakiella sp.]MDD7472309.1 phosphatase PAP2 family protein [Bacillota bacterium]MDY3923046.1 phosphatase PAP2 family protein [Ezakiella sp.]
MKLFSLNELDEHKKQTFILIAMFFLLALIYRYTNVPNPNAMDLKIKLDEYIHLIPFSVVIYHSWYPLLFVIMYYLRNDKINNEYISALFITKYLCLLTCIIFPSVVSIRQNIEAHDIFEKLIMLTYKVDAPYNGFPSIHVACATIAFHYCNGRDKLGDFFQLMMLLIIISTMTTRQHIIMDCLGGILYASIVLKYIMPKFRRYELNLFDPVI